MSGSWCVKCFKRPDEPAGKECGNPAWHTGHTCVATVMDERRCRWCGNSMEKEPDGLGSD